MIEVHAFATPNSVKVPIALEEMGLAYALKPVNVRKGEQKAPPSLLSTPTARCQCWLMTSTASGSS